MIKEEIIKKLQEIVKELTSDGSAGSPQEIKLDISTPKDIKNGDYSTNIAMQLFVRIKDKGLGIKSPMELAHKIMEEFNHSSLIINHSLDRVEAVKPGFINFYLSEEALKKSAEEVLANPEKAGTTESLKGKKVIVEFTDPNPFKELHIGHVYSNTIGEAISRLLQSQGATVLRADYFGDVGMHVAKALYGLEEKFKNDGIDLEDLGGRTLHERITYLGQAYATGSTQYEESTQAQEEVKMLNKLVYVAAQKMWQEEKGLEPQVDYTKGEILDKAKLERVALLYKTGRSWSLSYFDSIYERLGMKFDKYYPESIAGEKGYQLVQSHIMDGVFVEHEGAVIFPGKEHGLHNRVFINSLGLPTYEAKELGLALWKNEEIGYDRSIIVTGNEIDEYFRVLLKAMSLISPDLAEKTTHIGHGMVKLASGEKMSSRTGKIITGEDVLYEGQSLAKKKIEEVKKGANGLSSEESEEISAKVGIGAIKYSFLKSSIGKDVPFSFEESVSFEGNSGPYVQYTYTRTQSVLHKVQQNDELGITNYEFPKDYSPNEEEMEMLKIIYQFREVVEEAARTYSPNTITEYLFNLAQIFNNFYQKYRILNASGEQERDFRIALTAVVGIVIRQGLNLLGIQAPDKM